MLVTLPPKVYVFTCAPKIYSIELEEVYVFDVIALLFNDTSVTLLPPNAWLPISVTLDGMVILVRPVQPLNASSPIVVTGKFITL